MSQFKHKDQERFDLLLQSLLAGELSFDDAEVLNMAKREPEFAEQLEELLDLDRGVSLLASRTEILENLGSAEERDVALVAASLNRLASESGDAKVASAPAAPGPRALEPVPNRSPWGWVAAAAVLIASVMFGSKFLGSDDPEGAGPELAQGPQAGDPQDQAAPEFLGSENKLELLGPQGEVQDFETFEWRGELPEGCTFQVLIYDESALDFDPLAFSDRLEGGQSWKPTLEVRQSLQSIRWLVVVLNDSGAVVDGSEEAVAFRAGQ